MDKILDVKFDSIGVGIGYKKEFGFQLLKLEDVFSFKPSLKRNPFTPARVSFFVIIFLTEGTMTHEVDFVGYKMTKGDCIFISKGQIHKFDPSPTYKGYSLVFTEEYMLHHISPSALSKISFLYNNHYKPLFFKDFGDLDILIKTLKRELSFDLGSIKVNMAASMLTMFLLKAQLHANKVLKTHSENYGQFIQFQQLIASKYMQTRKAGHYAVFLNTTYKQLNTLCKEFTQKTAKEYIDTYVVLEAKRRLAMTKLPIKQVAYECGFSETTNFLKFFKKITNVTPAQFREMKV